ncbi:MAG: START-like domain-containing protein, partial [Bacteroidetes bacterium]|nr:START-like domain-containing protein [Bacteroidota bacterium]
GVLFNMFSTPSGLAEWFCDDVNIKQDVHTFVWDGSEESARIISKKREDFIKFRWIEDEEAGIPSFFEFRIKIDDMTGDTAIVITDFAEEDEIESSKELWGAQVDRLKQILGA